MKKQVWILSVLLVFVCAASVQAAFIVEAHSSGLANGNFSFGEDTTTASASTPSSAVGVTATNSIFGGNGADFPDTYVYSYTPGADTDNWAVPAYQYFGNGQYTTNEVGGQSGYYNVYITWPASTGVSSLCDIAITNDGADVVWTDIDMNTGGTIWLADQWDDHDPAATLYGGNNAWLKIADEIFLTAGETYTVTQTAQNNTYVSMRSHGVMWEFVAVPEPATLLMLGAGALALRRRQ